MRYHEELVNPQLSRLHPYPFERLRTLFTGITPPVALPPVRLSIGEPQHATPQLIVDALQAHMDGLAVYPTTAGLEQLRGTIAHWFERRYSVKLDPATQVLPVNGTREALFAIAQAVVDRSRRAPLVVCPNPFYQIYEGAALLAGAGVLFLNQTEDRAFAPDWATVTAEEWSRTHLLYVCSPGNPTGRVLTLEEWREIFRLSDRHGFVVASDECYSDIYDGYPPLGGLEAAARLGRTSYTNLVVFVSLSKRSNAPGMRSGAVAGDAAVLKQFLRYRTYHGSAMSLTLQHGSIAAWSDENHVEQNRVKYSAKFDAVVPLLSPVLHAPKPEAGFYLWARVPGGDDEAFARDLYATANVMVLPGQYLARDAHGTNPGRGYVRIALVPELSECVDAANRIAAFCASLR